MKKRYALPLIAAALLVTAFPALAADAPLPGLRGDLQRNIDDASGKLMELAAAVPADKYGWRPAEGVRSMSEVFMHVASANYYLATFVGEQWPAGVPQDLEKVTDKAKVTEALKASFENLRTLIAKTSDADLDRKIQMFGHDATVRAALLAMMTHLHEHLGQAIAYARTNGLVPPWTAREQAEQAKKKM
ncbi:MAG: DinB family protein [Acidobacteriota bacterium]